MDTLATIKDLDSYGIEYADEKLAGKLLESVSAAVRDAAGCPITRGEYTVTIPPAKPHAGSTCPCAP